MAKKNKKAKASKMPVNPTDSYLTQATKARSEYHAPVNVLFSLEEADFGQKWPDYSVLEFSDADVPELARMACDVRLDFGTPISTSAPIHAMRILALRKNAEFLPPLFATFNERDDYELFFEDMTKVLEAIGAPAIPHIQTYFASPEDSPFNRAFVSNGLVAIARKERALHAQAVGILTQELARFKDNSDEWNAFLIWDLTELGAGEALPLIEKAFAADAVDDLVCGDLQDVRAEFGLVAPRIDSNPPFLQDTRAARPSPFFVSTSKKPKP